MPWCESLSRLQMKISVLVPEKLFMEISVLVPEKWQIIYVLVPEKWKILEFWWEMTKKVVNNFKKKMCRKFLWWSMNRDIICQVVRESEKVENRWSSTWLSKIARKRYIMSFWSIRSAENTILKVGNNRGTGGGPIMTSKKMTANGE